MQLLQFSGLLEQQAHRLRQDALKLQAAALCGSASTNFLNLMENFYGVDEEEEEGTLEDAASFTAFVKQHREEREKEKASAKLSVSKGSVEKEELGDEEEDEEDIEDSASTTSSVSKRKTLKQLKSQLLIRRNIPRNVISKRPNYSSPPLPLHCTIQVSILNISALMKAYLDTKGYTAVCLRAATTGLR